MEYFARFIYHSFLMFFGSFLIWWGLNDYLPVSYWHIVMISAGVGAVLEKTA